MTSVKPALHIFPPVEQVQRRRESLDELIRKSMDMRPTGLARPRGRAAGRRSPSPSPYEVQAAGVSTTDFAEQMSEVQRAPLHPLQTSLPAARRNMSQSPSRRRPRRCPSASRNRRGPSPAPAHSYMRMQSTASSMASTMNHSPVSPSDSNTSSQDVRSNADTEITIPDRSAASSRASNRKHVVLPIAQEPVVAPSAPSVVDYPSIPRSGAASPASSLHRTASVRAPSRAQVTIPPAPIRRVVSPTPSEQTLVMDSNEELASRGGLPITLKSHFSPITPEETALPMRSIFPMYNPGKPMNRQSRPAHITPIMVTKQQVAKPEYSPSLLRQVMEPPRQPVHINDVADLEKLWNCTNGQIITLEPKKFAMKMHRPIEGGKRQKINFGPTETQPFFSLSQQHPSAEDTDGLHEVLIFRHAMANEDILPICHSMLQAPPAPSLSKITRANVASPTSEPSVQITTITPILATLHSLDNAAKTPQAHTLALVDPRATSPAAARLAERAVADAIAREACTLSWTKLDATKGKYELHHPSLGIFNINVEGDIATGMAKSGSRFTTSITITNPFAGSAPTAVSTQQDNVLARLDFVNDTLELDAAAIQQLGNIYLIDVCVSTLLSVAVAEAQRPQDQGLIFAAPPPSPFANPNASKKERKKMEKAIAAASDTFSATAASGTAPPSATSSTMSLIKSGKKPKRKTILTPGTDMSLTAIEHMINADDLPRITRGILSVLGLSFKTAVWLLGVGFRLTAGLIVGISRIAARD